MFYDTCKPGKFCGVFLMLQQGKKLIPRGVKEMLGERG
jgi:hypothetical protein